ncbi:MAG: hypothetical protein A6F71_08940 [Cycloclasticus sp. symbiont of Poecilosclerida sp. M]|nr:MAG: hypothetical protein A6F71_08940 [Cycloclasticus sp. symbiont of Poecilosclerida sp. M]
MSYFCSSLSLGFVLAGIVIGVEETLVTVPEDVGERELCAVIIRGETARDIEVTVVYQNRGAMGE